MMCGGEQVGMVTLMRLGGGDSELTSTGRDAASGAGTSKMLGGCAEGESVATTVDDVNE